MAHLKQEEFTRAVAFLAEDLGLQRLRDRLVRLNAFVMRRRATSAERLANQLYMLTSGLRRQVPATAAFHALWDEQIAERVGEEGEKPLAELADGINECLDAKGGVLPEQEGELDGRVRAYEERLAARVGAARARLDTLLKAFPAVAERLRAMPLPEAAPDEESSAPEGEEDRAT